MCREFSIQNEDNPKEVKKEKKYVFDKSSVLSLLQNISDVFIIIIDKIICTT